MHRDQECLGLHSRMKFEFMSQPLLVRQLLQSQAAGYELRNVGNLS